MASIAQTSGDRSVSVGRVFERAFSTIRHNPRVTLGLALLFGAIPTLLSGYLLTLAPGDPEADAFVFFAFLFAYWFLSIIVGVFSLAALTRATVAQAEGHRASFQESLSAAARVLLPATLLALVIGVGFLVGFALLIVPGIILYVIWSVATPALVEERRGVFKSLGRSAALTKGTRWSVFAVLLLLFVVYWLFAAVVELAGWASGFDLTGEQGLSVGFFVSNMVIGLVMNLLWGVVQASLYVELRDARDGPAADRLEEIFA